MKKLYTIFAAILLTGSIAFAEIVDESKAETIAARWLGCEPVLCWEGPQTKADQEALFYVYNNPQGGWVMISALFSPIAKKVNSSAAVCPCISADGLTDMSGPYAK